MIRLFTTHDMNTAFGPTALMRKIKGNINRFSTYGKLLSDTPFTYVAGPNPDRITLGNTYQIDGPAGFNPYVLVTGEDRRSWEFTTLKGHPEAGRIKFWAEQRGGRLRFNIQSHAHPATRVNRALYGIPVVGGYSVQTGIWDSFIEAVGEYVFDEDESGI